MYKLLLSLLTIIALAGGFRVYVSIASEIWYRVRKAKLGAMYRPWRTHTWSLFHDILAQPQPWYVRADNWLMLRHL